ncbi:MULTISPECIES: PIN domain-containing protein [unclassified Archaeoglobus]|uniref:PIN domain-containing protein n=1 Tax=unclassified Archaeoglobus TaxID=2643606 RepID=UPI0025B80462|nr:MULTISPECIES: PIN domain-containing protein [unclassified Archaeoglobus]
MKSYENLKKTVFFCPDTNILYHRFMTNLGIDLRSVLLVNVVRDEIEASLNFKYSPSQIAELKKDAKYQSFLLDEFINRRMKRSRLACIALTEYRELRRYAVEIEGVESSTNDKEQNDLTIVKTLRRFERERAALPVMLTADRQMADLCEAEGIEYFHFSIPHAVKADFCDHSGMIKLIYSLAMVFGVVRLNSVVVFGEFKGKKKIEELKLRFLDNEFWKSFEKHLRICRRLMELGIKQ